MLRDLLEVISTAFSAVSASLSLSAISQNTTEIDRWIWRREVGGLTGGWRTRRLPNTSSTWLFPYHTCWISGHALTRPGVNKMSYQLAFKRQRTPRAERAMNGGCRRAEVTWWRNSFDLPSGLCGFRQTLLTLLLVSFCCTTFYIR